MCSQLGPLRVQQPPREVLLRPEVNARGQELQTMLRHDRPGNALRSPPRQRGHDWLAPILLDFIKARRHFAPCFPEVPVFSSVRRRGGKIIAVQCKLWRDGGGGITNAPVVDVNVSYTCNIYHVQACPVSASDVNIVAA